MTDAGWAGKVIEKARLNYNDGEPSSFINVDQARTMLLKEHARSVRIVKQYLKRYGTEGSPCELICNDLLTALQRGRGGKG